MALERLRQGPCVLPGEATPLCLLFCSILLAMGLVHKPRFARSRFPTQSISD